MKTYLLSYGTVRANAWNEAGEEVEFMASGQFNLIGDRKDNSTYEAGNELDAIEDHIAELKEAGIEDIDAMDEACYGCRGFSVLYCINGTPSLIMAEEVEGG